MNLDSKHRIKASNLVYSILCSGDLSKYCTATCGILVADPENEMIWISVYIDTGSAKHLAYWENGNCTFLFSPLGIKSWMGSTFFSLYNHKVNYLRTFFSFLVQLSRCVASGFRFSKLLQMKFYLLHSASFI